MNRPRSTIVPSRFQLSALALALLMLAGCGSSEPSGDAAPAATAEAPPASDEAPSAEAGGTDESGGGGEAVECDTSTFVYEPFTEIPADWPESFPRPELLEDIDGELGNGCDRVTVDMRGRYTGPARDWMAEYGDRLSAAGFELSEDTDELGQVLRTYRLGEDVINYGGDIELPDSDEEYITVGIVLTDFPG